uniref:Uncharacterized protein n=1 Tax=Arundo donax TaxID=35708 RepID=A0A0A9EAP0_ARUDO
MGIKLLSYLTLLQRNRMMVIRM